MYSAVRYIPVYGCRSQDFIMQSNIYGMSSIILTANLEWAHLNTLYLFTPAVQQEWLWDQILIINIL